MNHAKETDFETVKEIFYQHKKWFPHIRTDYMKRMIAKDNLILDNDVVITYNFYKRKQRIGNVIAQQGDCILHHCEVMHGSKENKSKLNRVGIVMSYKSIKAKIDKKGWFNYQQKLKKNNILISKIN